VARKKDDGESALDLAERVLDGLVKARTGAPWSEQDRDVRRLIVGLACIDELTRNYSRAAAERVASAETGANEALAIIDAWTSGRDHPTLWKYFEGVRSLKHDPHHAPVNGIDAQRQYMIVGLGLAYEEAAKCTRAEAFRDVAHACRLPDLSFDAKLIEKSWLNNSGKKYRKGDQAAMKGIRFWQSHFKRKANAMISTEPLSDKILQVGRRLICRAWSVSIRD
jgi:hypothetical protein